jgi:CRISPR-associated protein Cas1
MIKRVIEISAEPCHLRTAQGQLVIMRRPSAQAAGTTAGDRDAEPTTLSIPMEDIGLVMIDQLASSVTTSTLGSLADYGVAVCFCDARHLPTGLLLPLADRHETVWRIGDQISTTKPTRKRLWRQIVRAKIHGQRANLDPASSSFSKLAALRDSVRSGDPRNVESQAARVYWANWLGREHGFVRVAGGGGHSQPPNNLLDYGYAVMRAAMARAIVSAGLVPALGVHHENRSNSFCLADDLMEPLRPLVDRQVRALFQSGIKTLSRESKAQLLSLLTATVVIPGDDGGAKRRTGPLAVALHRYVSSFVECLPDMSQRRRLAIPQMCPQ